MTNRRIQGRVTIVDGRTGEVLDGALTEEQWQDVVRRVQTIDHSGRVTVVTLDVPDSAIMRAYEAWAETCDRRARARARVRQSGRARRFGRGGHR